MATIRIENLRLESIIGVHPEEQEHPQPLVLNIELETDITAAAKSDSIEDALDYQRVYDQVVELVQSSRCFLVEHLAQQILDLVLSDKAVESATIKIDKPNALELADSVSIEVSSRGKSQL